MVPAMKIACLLTGVTGLVGSALAAPAAEGGRKFTTELTGAAEVPGPGDPDGSGTARIILNHGQSRICYEITVSNIATPTAAHIHEAAADASGPVVVPLFMSSGGPLSDCVDASRELIKEIIQNPGDYYVNVHNADFPPGAIRGQLSK